MMGLPNQNWRQIMQQAQPMPQNTGSMFPIRGAGGGWMMPGGPAPFVPKPLQQPAPKQEIQAPGNGRAFYSAPMMGIGVGGMSDASRGWSPGFDGQGWGFGGMGTADGSPGWGGLLGFGDVGQIGLDAGTAGGPGAAGIGGGGNDVGGFGWW